jgi:hypothetical protein
MPWLAERSPKPRIRASSRGEQPASPRPATAPVSTSLEADQLLQAGFFSAQEESRRTGRRVALTGEDEQIEDALPLLDDMMTSPYATRSARR